jgi:YgiT-type zinc finger domain-containing protein
MVPRIMDLPFDRPRNTTVIIQGIPVEQCSSCGEIDIDQKEMLRIEEILASCKGEKAVEEVKFAA